MKDSLLKNNIWRCNRIQLSVARGWQTETVRILLKRD